MHLTVVYPVVAEVHTSFVQVKVQIQQRKNTQNDNEMKIILSINNLFTPMCKKHYSVVVGQGETSFKYLKLCG